MIVAEAENILRDMPADNKDRSEEVYGQIWDSQDQEWTNAWLYHATSGTGHVFRIKVDGKTMVEMRGLEFGVVMSGVLKRWEERNI